MDINNSQVNEVYERCRRIFSNIDEDESVRLKYFTCMQIVEAIAYIYENGEVLSEEDIDDLFIAWEEDRIRPVYPEEYNGLKEKIRNKLKEMEEKEEESDTN